MREENFIYFFTIIGFFIGIIIGIINTSDAFSILIYTCLVTGFFYLIIHIIISLYIDLKSPTSDMFDRKTYEDDCDLIINEMEIKEQKLRNILEFVYGKEVNAKK